MQLKINMEDRQLEWWLVIIDTPTDMIISSVSYDEVDIPTDMIISSLLATMK